MMLPPILSRIWALSVQEWEVLLSVLLWVFLRVSRAVRRVELENGKVTVEFLNREVITLQRAAPQIIIINPTDASTSPRTGNLTLSSQEGKPDSLKENQQE
jgi:hypothetical protein